MTGFAAQSGLAKRRSLSTGASPAGISSRFQTVVASVR